MLNTISDALNRTYGGLTLKHLSNMEIYGKIIEVTPIESGTSERGTWERRSLVISTLEQNPTNIAFTAMGKRLEDVANTHIGDVVKVRFGLSSRKSENKWYSDIVLWGIEKP